jgi:hypothetical protein
MIFSDAHKKHSTALWTLEQGLEDEYRSEIDLFVKLFMRIKDKIKIEDLTIYEPIFTSNIQSKCPICNGFANIHCVNCKDNIWLCVDHWKQHKANAHS